MRRWVAIKQGHYSFVCLIMYGTSLHFHKGLIAFMLDNGRITFIFRRLKEPSSDKALIF